MSGTIPRNCEEDAEDPEKENQADSETEAKTGKKGVGGARSWGGGSGGRQLLAQE